MFRKRRLRLTELAREIDKLRANQPGAGANDEQPRSAPEPEPRRVSNAELFTKIRHLEKGNGNANIPLV